MADFLAQIGAVIVGAMLAANLIYWGIMDERSLRMTGDKFKPPWPVCAFALVAAAVVVFSVFLSVQG